MMHLPIELQKLVHDYARPITKMLVKGQCYTGEIPYKHNSKKMSWHATIEERTHHSALLKVAFKHGNDDNKFLPISFLVRKDIKILHLEGVAPAEIVYFNFDRHEIDILIKHNRMGFYLPHVLHTFDFILHTP